MSQSPLHRLEAALRSFDTLAVAVSGGVDSMTLAHAAHRVLGEKVRMYHAASPAVPAEAGARVRSHGARWNWNLTVIDAGEFADPQYRSNPLNRCYFCKSNLFERIRGETDDPLATGANLDDLDDFRPGLRAAAERGVIHPFIDARLGKEEVRRLARGWGLSDIAELPAQPCLASRVETGIAIEADDMALVGAVERELATRLGPGDIRCRITGAGVRIEVSPPLLGRLQDDEEMLGRLAARCRAAGRPFLGASPYRRGSAFLRDEAQT